MQQYAELYHLTSLNSLQQLIVSLMNIIKYFRREFNTNRSKKRPHWLTEMKIISLERTEFNDTPNNEVKNDEASSFILNFLAAIQNATFRHSYQLLSSLQRTCMHAQSGHSPNETISCAVVYWGSPRSGPGHHWASGQYEVQPGSLERIET